jgi:SsrA-binding protein
MRVYPAGNLMAVQKKNKKNVDDPNSRTVCRNRRARHEYDVLDEIDCGIQLYGSEVKSIRNNKIVIEDAYGRVDGNEVWLINSDIAEYPQATIFNHERRRKRKLLLKRREIQKFAKSGEQQGLTLVPLAVFMSRGFVKVKLGLCRGRKLHDKRQNLKKQDHQREIEAAMKHRR